MLSHLDVETLDLGGVHLFQRGHPLLGLGSDLGRIVNSPGLLDDRDLLLESHLVLDAALLDRLHLALEPRHHR